MNENYQSEYEIRLKKLENIKKAGIDPYPSKFCKTNFVSDIKTFKDGTDLKTAGRIMTIREMGKIIFCHLQDQSGKAQIVLKKDELNDKQFEFFLDNLDMGDFIGVEGNIFTTQKGEKSLLIKKYNLLSKAILPMPEKWHGLKDEEERLRKRYLDILTDPKIKDLLIKKMVFWHSVREFLLKNNFIEVETPVLETTAGGADARPFITHHNALDIDIYLRISMGELWQKKLMVAGFDKTFEIGRQFRNEGIDAEHLQDYTQMEYYWAYADWNDGMKLTEELIKYVAKKTFGTLKFNIKGQEVDLSTKWEKYDYKQEILNRTGLDIENIDLKDIKNKLQELKVKYDDFNNLERGIDQLWKYCRKQIIGPGYLIYPPKIISPLAKESLERPGYTERYQLILAGSELCNGYSELNDPLDQEKRFEKQTELKEAGDEEAQMHDKDFVEALKHGMPPTTGLGISERLFAFLADKTLRECQFFPLVKPLSKV
ncbi:MAG: lysine--tRNA ligase [Patescibacteria group bacterium]